MQYSYAGRAKQFLPYASLRGYDKIVEEKNRVKSPRRELGEDGAEELSRTLLSLSRGARASLTYYNVDAYVTREVEFISIDEIRRTIKFSNLEIPISDIFSLILL